MAECEGRGGIHVVRRQDPTVAPSRSSGAAGATFSFPSALQQLRSGQEKRFMVAWISRAAPKNRTLLGARSGGVADRRPAPFTRSAESAAPGLGGSLGKDIVRQCRGRRRAAELSCAIRPGR